MRLIRKGKTVFKAIYNGTFLQLCRKKKTSLRNHWHFLYEKNTYLKEQHYQRKIYEKLYGRYQGLIEKGIDSCQPMKSCRKVWICWFQGIEQAPDLVKACVESAGRTMSDREIILLTEENLEQYVEFPDYIMEKRNKGIIPPAQFSDLLRLELLCKYGGLWIDATVYCTDKAHQRELILKEPLFVYKQFDFSREQQMPSAASNWLIGAHSNHPILLLTKELLYAYWKDYNYLMDYYIFHFFFKMASKRYKKEWERIPLYNNHSPHTMQMELERDYTGERWAQLLRMSDFHKLNRYVDFSKNKQSIYRYIVESYKENSKYEEEFGEEHGKEHL